MSQALYRKYRSRKFGEVVGQQHITKTLTNALKSGKISHAYLFTGPRGVGKTSVARILAREVNNLKYDEDKSHLDIIEIDAASNRRIDEIRDLREKVHIAPSSAKYKVYIIDEVHMLTKEAFNALLKTLEEPPAHVIFILATTEAHKLPETIISRTQRFSFKPISTIDAIAHLKNIAKTEGIKIDDKAIDLLAKHGEGSFRDSISLLDQVSGHQDKVSLDDVRTILGIAPSEAIESIVEIIESGSAQRLIDKLEEIKLKGYHAPIVAKQLGEYYRTQLINEAVDRQSVVNLLKKLIGVPASQEPDQMLELVLLEQLLSHNEGKTADDEEKVITQPKENIEASPQVAQTIVGKKHETGDAWTKILSAIKKQHSTLYSTLRMASADFANPQTLILKFNFAFHKKRLEEDKNLAILRTTAKEVVGKAVKIICEVKAPAASVKPSNAPIVDNKAGSGKLETISNIFGDGEVLES